LGQIANLRQPDKLITALCFPAQGCFHLLSCTKGIIKAKYTLKKHERLKSRKLLDQLFRGGNNFFLYPIKVYYQSTASPINAPVQAGFGVSARVFKKAVDRNRIKRLMREAYRLQKPALLEMIGPRQEKLAVFFLYVGKEVPEYETVKEKLLSVIERLSRSVNQIS
ncbi:MAG: ribonuclease P protein component, partial [Chitinophagaceae bacterium]